jgi:hypothetical protein
MGGGVFHATDHLLGTYEIRRAWHPRLPLRLPRGRRADRIGGRDDLLGFRPHS